jgi:hypothetical protein
MNKSNTHTRPTKPSRPSNPMEICFKVGVALYIDWQIVIDDHVDLVDVDSTSENVCGDKDLGFPGAEGVHDGIAFSCVTGTMEDGDDVSVFSHPTCNLICRVSSLARLAYTTEEGNYSNENDTLTNVHDAVETNEDFVFVLFIATVHVQLLDSLDAQFFRFEGDFVCIGRKCLGKDADLIWECRTKQQHLRILWDRPVVSFQTRMRGGLYYFLTRKDCSPMP